MLAPAARARAIAFLLRAASTAAAPERVPLYKNVKVTDANLANVGVRWTEAEVQALVKRVEANESVEGIALKHQRTANSIRAKLATLAGAAITADPAAQASVLAKYRVTAADIEELNQRNAARREAVKQGKTAAKAPKANANASANASAKAEAVAVAADPNAPPRPAMVGKPWLAEHNEELMKQAAARKSIADISTLLARTPKSVEMRIAHLSLDKGMAKVCCPLPPLPLCHASPRPTSSNSTVWRLCCDCNIVTLCYGVAAVL